jgi:hypothetical protein
MLNAAPGAATDGLLVVVKEQEMMDHVCFQLL